MELAAAAVSALVTVTGQHLCGCVCSGMNLQSNHGALKKEMKSLMDRREEVEDETRKADDQGHGIRADVKKWLVDVEELLRKNNPILGPPQCSLNC
ncbi:disease resistance protein At4g27190-like, partial [Fagus crenata]